MQLTIEKQLAFYEDVEKRVEKEEGKTLTSNDFTDTLKAKLDGIETGANKTIVDSAISDTSENPVQNKVIKAELDTKGSGSSEQIEEALKIIGGVNRSLASTQLDLLQVEMVVKTLSDADIIYSNNAVIEDFSDISDITLVRGQYDSTNKVVYA